MPSTEDLLQLAPDGDESAHADAAHWCVLIADDDADVHRATELALHGCRIEGRALRFLHAYSAAQALRIVESEPEVCVVLLDVVMERPDAGLQLVRQLRSGPGRPALRVLLRTGQPGYAPEIETVRDFEIDDYCAKSEMTSVRLFTSLTTAIRSYRLIGELQRQRDELARANDALEATRLAERRQAERLLAAERALRDAHETTEQCIAQRTQELSDAVGRLESFNRMVSHDLRGPLSGLAGISAMIDAALERGDVTRTRHWLSLMQQQTRRLMQLVDDLLQLARASSGRLARVELRLDEVVDEAAEMLALYFPHERVACLSASALPVLPVDAGLMRQVFVNLLGNALKFTRRTETPRIEVAARADGAEWIVSVTDNGEGFDAQRGGELFRPFGRLHGAEVEGSGIGLTIVRRIVERHGGRVWAECPAEGGARFCFSLPRDGGG